MLKYNDKLKFKQENIDNMIHDVLIFQKLIKELQEDTEEEYLGILLDNYKKTVELNFILSELKDNKKMSKKDTIPSIKLAKLIYSELVLLYGNTLPIE